MDSKEIIINKVNVSGCYFLNRGITNLLCTCLSEIDEECKYNPNCYFKQLQRKTAECEKYEQKLHKISDYIKDNCNHCQITRYNGCERCDFEQIMNIIKSVKESNND